MLLESDRYTYVCMFACMYVCIHVYSESASCSSGNSCVLLESDRYMYAYTYIHTYIYLSDSSGTHTHTYTHTCIHTVLPESLSPPNTSTHKTKPPYKPPQNHNVLVMWCAHQTSSYWTSHSEPLPGTPQR